MDQRKSLLLLAALLLALAAWWLGTAGSGAPDAPRAVDGGALAESASGSTNRSLRPVAIPGGEEERSTAAIPAGPGVGAVAAPDPDAVPDQEAVTVTGHWIVIDELGLRRDAERGQFSLELYGSGSPPREIAVEAGRWTAELPARATFGLSRLELGGRRAVPARTVGGLIATAGTELVLEARWVNDSELVVVDADTRAELANLEIVGPHVGDGPWSHPGPFDPEDLLAAGVASPVLLPAPAELDAWGDSEPLWVRAPDHAWGRIVVPRGIGGEFLLALGPAGDLRLRVRGADASQELWLRLREPGTEVADHEGVRFELLLAGREVLDLDSLAVGSYTASVEAGHRYQEPRVLAVQPCAVRAGERTEVTLVVGSFEAPPRARLAGTLIVPPQWELASFGLFLDRVSGPPGVQAARRYVERSAMRLVDEETGAWAWTAEDLEVGGWELRMNPLGTSTAVVLDVRGRDDVVLTVPPPTEVLVHVRDAASGEPVDDVRVHWMPDREGLTSGGVLNGAGRVEPGTFRFRCPAGDVDVWCMSDRHRFHRELVSVGSGTTEVTLELPLACGLLLSLRDGDTLLDIGGLDPTITRLDGEGEGWLTDEDPQRVEARYTMTAPGLYRIEVPAPDGFAPIEPLEIEIPDGRFVEHVVDLRRER